jgi:hypothetical protein
VLLQQRPAVLLPSATVPQLLLLLLLLLHFC